ncbi:MAG: biopolymer transporter Tol, partial [Algoriphagus sp.]
MKHNIGNQVSTQISSFDTSIEVFDVSSRMNKVAYSVRNGKESQLFVDSYTGVDQFTPSTPRLQLAQVKELNERLAARRILEAKTQQATRAKQEQQAGPELVLPLTSLDTLSKKTSSLTTDRLRFETRKGVNTENYTFDTIPSRIVGNPGQIEAKQETAKNSILDTFRKQNLQKLISGPRPMESQFFTNHINSRFIVDPLRGFGINLQGKMTDVLDNHQFMGGIMYSLDFDSGGDVWFEYQYLKSRLDFRGRYDRKTLTVTEGDISFQKYTLTKVETGVAYPLSIHSRLYAAPFVAKTQYFNLNEDSLIYSKIPALNQLNVSYAGGKVEFVYDRTEPMGLYAFTGT